MFILLSIFILTYALFNYKRAFLIFLVYKIFLVTNITVLSIPGVPLLTLDLFMTLCFLGLYFTNRTQVEIDTSPFPYKVPFIWLSVSWFVSTIFAYVGFVGAFSQFVKYVMELPVTVWLMWILINRDSDISFLLRWLTFAIMGSCIYGFYEYAVQANPLVEYEATLVGDTSRAIDFMYGVDSDRGYRVQSVFEHAIGAGLNWAIYFIMIFVVMVKFRWRSPMVKWALLSVAFTIPALFFTNSRASILFLGIGSLAFVDIKSRRFNQLFIALLVAIALSLPYLSQYVDNILSLFDSEAQARVGGSSVDLRFMQLEAAISVMMQSPIWGFGFKFRSVMDNSLTASLLGMESIWFEVFTQFGLLGVTSYLIYAYYSIVKIPRLYNSRVILFISLAYWVVSTLTSTPGMLVYLYYLVIIITIKLTRSWYTYL